MDFCDFATSYDFYRCRGVVSTRDEFAKLVVRELEDRRFSQEQEQCELLRFHAERIWTDLDRPYFNVWPDIIPLLSDVNVDVPTQCLRLPYDVFVLRLPKSGSPLRVNESFQVRSILTTEFSDPQQRTVVLWIDIGETEPGGLPMLYWRRLRCDKHQTIEQAFDTAPRELPGVLIPDVLARKCMRLVISTCFLSTGMDRLISPDVLSRDFSAYIEAQRKQDEVQIRVIKNRALRRRGPGWHIGQPDRFRPLFAASPSDVSNIGAGRELTHQHQRRAHFRMLKGGEVVFVRQATVRPDLPANRPAAYTLR